MSKGVGLVLEGGGYRGIFTAGVLDYFNQKRIKVNYTVSVSAGVCNAMDYVSNQFGRTRSCMVPMGRNPYPIDWRYLIKGYSIVDFDLIFNKYPNEIVPFDFDKFSKSDCKCEYVVTNCLTGESEYVEEKKDQKRMFKVSEASCSMPYVCPIVKLDDTPYLDGAISDPIPIRHAIEMGYDKNIVILTNMKGYRKKVPKVVGLVNKMFYYEYPNLVKVLNSRQDTYNNTIRYVEELEKQGKILVIRPEEITTTTFSNNHTNLMNFYEQGFRIADNLKQEIHKYLNK